MSRVCVASDTVDGFDLDCTETDTTKVGLFYLCDAHRISEGNRSNRSKTKTILRALEPETGFIYFLKVPSTGRIKIGRTTDVKARLQDHEEKFGQKLELLALIPGGVATEARIHERFDHLRVNNVLAEQFTPDFELLSYIANLQSIEGIEYYRDWYKTYRYSGTKTRNNDYYLEGEND